MTRKRSGWRAAERTYRHLSRELARKAAESVRREREALALTVCPDGLACNDPLHVEARRIIMAGGGWRGAFAVLYPKERV